MTHPKIWQHFCVLFSWAAPLTVLLFFPGYSSPIFAPLEFAVCILLVVRNVVGLTRKRKMNDGEKAAYDKKYALPIPLKVVFMLSLITQPAPYLMGELSNNPPTDIELRIMFVQHVYGKIF